MTTLTMEWGTTGRIVLTLNARGQPEQSPQVLRLLGEPQDARLEALGRQGTEEDQGLDACNR